MSLTSKEMAAALSAAGLNSSPDDKAFELASAKLAEEEAEKESKAWQAERRRRKRSKTYLMTVRFSKQELNLLCDAMLAAFSEAERRFGSYHRKTRTLNTVAQGLCWAADAAVASGDNEEKIIQHKLN